MFPLGLKKISPFGDWVGDSYPKQGHNVINTGFFHLANTQDTYLWPLRNSGRREGSSPSIYLLTQVMCYNFLILNMFSPVKGRFKDKLYELCELNEGNFIKKKDICHLHHDARKGTLSSWTSNLLLKGLASFHVTLKTSPTVRML